MDNALLKLTELYTSKHRHYHNLIHIANMLTMAPQELTFEQQVAVWFHDAVYNPISDHNEEDSVELVTKLLDIDYIDQRGDINIITEIILSTKDHTPRCPEANLVLDLDLAILGQPAPIYQQYVKNVAAEYAPFIPTDIYRYGRQEFLKRFLEKDSFYYTDWGKRYLDEKARENLKSELSKYTKD